MNIPNNNLKRSFEIYKTEIEEKALEVLRSGWYILGKEVERFEDSFSKAIGSKYCIGVDNGLNAIMLGCRALNIGFGDEVIVQANTYIATLLGVTINGATPILVEPNKYFNIDTSLIESKITKRTKAILVTHLFGQASEMDKIVAICKKHNLFLLEDCAQSHFASFNGKNTGTFGVLGFFSFYPTKNIGALGDAGAIITDQYELSQKIRMLRNYGSIKRYNNEIEGYNSRLDELQAGFLNVKMKHILEIIDERQKIAKKYLSNIKNPKIELPKVQVNCSHVWHLFVIKVKEREKFRESLINKGIATDVHYPIPPHLSGAYKRLGYKVGDFPITENNARTIVSIPIFNGMEEEEIDYVISIINNYVE